MLVFLIRPYSFPLLLWPFSDSPSTTTPFPSSTASSSPRPFPLPSSFPSHLPISLCHSSLPSLPLSLDPSLRLSLKGEGEQDDFGTRIGWEEREGGRERDGENEASLPHLPLRPFFSSLALTPLHLFLSLTRLGLPTRMPHSHTLRRNVVTCPLRPRFHAFAFQTCLAVRGASPTDSSRRKAGNTSATSTPPLPPKVLRDSGVRPYQGFPTQRDVQGAPIAACHSGCYSAPDYRRWKAHRRRLGRGAAC